MSSIGENSFKKNYFWLPCIVRLRDVRMGMTAMKILLPYASIHGSTAEIAEFIAGVLEQHHLDTTLMPVEAVQGLADYDIILPGGPIHTGRWVRPMLVFLRQYQSALQGKIVFPWLTCVR